MSIRILFTATLGLAAILMAQNTVPASGPAAPALVVERLPALTDSMLQRKLDSISIAAEAAGTALRSQSELDSAGKASADSVSKAIADGKYIERATYDVSNFDHWKIDTVFQQKMKDVVKGEWRTELIPHGHAFRDASLRFAANDTLYGVTRTYSDSGRYQMTGEYKFQARYRFSNDSTIVSREVFLDRNVVRWDHIRFKVTDNKLSYHLSKLEFRDLNDNWLNALQGFENVPAEIYKRSAAAPAAK